MTAYCPQYKTISRALRREALVPGEINARSWDFLRKVLHTSTTNETKLALNQHREEQHADKGTESHEIVNLQRGNDPDETCDHTEQ